MIQRIQTVFLALAGLSGFSLFLQPMDFARVQDATGLDTSLFSDGVFDIQDHTALLVLAVLLGVIPLITIFLFKNRALQLKLDKVAIALGVLLLAVAAFFFYQEGHLLKAAEPMVSLGAASPILSVIFLFLANRFIKKDDRLVRSADRLR